MWKKSPFWQDNALFASKAKINFFLFFLVVETGESPKAFEGDPA